MQALSEGFPVWRSANLAYTLWVGCAAHKHANAVHLHGPLRIGGERHHEDTAGKGKQEHGQRDKDQNSSLWLKGAALHYPLLATNAA
jgi:hypothetical protein